MQPARPLIIISAALAAGALAAMWVSAEPLTAIAAAVVSIAAVVVAYTRGQRSWNTIFIAVFLFSLLTSAMRQTPSKTDLSRLSGTTQVIEAVIASDIEIRDNSRSFLVRPHDIISRQPVAVSGKLSVVLIKDAVQSQSLQRLEYGQNIRLEARISRPTPPENPGQFSYKEYLARQGVFAVAFIDDPLALQPLTVKRGNVLAITASEARNHLVSMMQSRLSERQASLVSAMLLGNYGMVPEDLLENFTRSGTLHLLAASGFNCALIVALFWHGLARMFRAPKIPALLLTMALTVFYVAMVGAKPSIVRAGVGSLIYLGALLIGRPSSLLNTLFATAAIMLAFNPLAVGDVGFQLSFSAVLFIVLFVPWMESRLPAFLRHPVASKLNSLPQRFASHLAAVALVTIAATAATLPILATNFNRVSLVSLVANAAVAFVAELLFVSGVALSLLYWIPGVGWILSRFVALFADAVDLIVSYMGSQPFAEINVASPPLALILVWYGLFGWLGWRITRSGVSTTNATTPVAAE